MTELNELTLAEARDGLKARSFSARELTQAHISAVEKARALNAYPARDAGPRPDDGRGLGRQDRAAARRAPSRVAARHQGPVLHPGGRHDGGLQDPRGLRAALQIGRHPQALARRRRDARQAQSRRVRHGLLERDQRLRQRDLALAPPGERDALGHPIVPGGSSGGSAAAVAARLCLGATATDTGGSIRQPAAFTGTVGIKPTYGRCSRWGMVAFASSLDQAGPIARTVRDCAILLGSMAGPDPQATPPASTAGPGFRGGGVARREGPHHRHPEGVPGRRHAGRDREALGRAAPSGSRPRAPRSSRSRCRTREYALPAYYIVAPAEASSNLARYDGVRYGLRVPGARHRRACTRTPARRASAAR